jgi:hypothetical protein
MPRARARWMSWLAEHPRRPLRIPLTEGRLIPVYPERSVRDFSVNRPSLGRPRASGCWGSHRRMVRVFMTRF